MTEVLHSKEALFSWRARQKEVALVPTMGALHAGHLALMRAARERGGSCLVSIFVNPLQFGPQEDFLRYPRNLEEDVSFLEKEGVEAVFAPSAEDIYPEPQVVFVELPPIAHDLCGASRPGHFRGVATVVLKLMHLSNPGAAVFGKKDWQQWFLVRLMARQLALSAEIAGVPTVREEDGLAASSRNRYLGEEERQRASALYRTLLGLAHDIVEGRRDFRVLEDRGAKVLSRLGWQVDYIAIRSQKTLLPAELQDTALVILGAASIGGVRLIDNVELLLPEAGRG